MIQCTQMHNILRIGSIQNGNRTYELYIFSTWRTKARNNLYINEKIIIFVQYNTSNQTNMKYVAYINSAQQDVYSINIVLLGDCIAEQNVYREGSEKRLRSEWGKFIDSLENGDVAVLHSFNDAFYNFHDMIFFLKFCFKKNIRIISLEDSLDTEDKLFAKAKLSKTADTLNLMCRMFAKRDRNSHDDFESELYYHKHSDRLLKRHRMVINMYNAGYNVKEIMDRTGYRAKSNIYRILHEYSVTLEYPSMVRGQKAEKAVML